MSPDRDEGQARAADQARLDQLRGLDTTELRRRVDAAGPFSSDRDTALTRRVLFGRRYERRAEAEAARDRAERADPGTAGMVEARDLQAAGGRFDDADSTQRLIDATVRRSAERAERRQAEDRETDAKHAVERFPFWHDRDRPEPGPTDRPGLYARAHQVQGQTRDRAHWDRPGPGYADRMVGRTRGRGEHR